MKTMKCANLHAINDLRFENITIPECGEDEVLVKVYSCGICGSDIPRVYTKGTYSFPTVIGHEFSGKVIIDPKNEYEGQKVAIFPLIPCFKCASCKKENYATCQNYDYYGSRRNGGMSEYISVKRWNLCRVPKKVSYVEAAMCEPVAVARHAIGKLQIKAGDNLLISGAGTIGLLAGQWAKSFGAANVYYFDIDLRKINFAKSLGFLEYEKNVSIDCTLEGTGFSDAFNKCLEAVNAGGRVVLMGNPAKEVTLTQKAYWHILRKELTVRGTWNSSYNEVQNDWIESLNAIAEGKIQVKPLITHIYPLKECNQAFEMMKNKMEFFCKVMLSMEEQNEID